MRRWLCWLLLVGTVLGQTGCFINRYSSNPIRRMTQLLNTSEDLRQVENEWERFWMVDHPSTLTPDRVSGVIQP